MNDFLVHKDQEAENFWEIIAEENVITRIWGKLGTKGKSKSTEYSSIEAVDKAYQKFILEKRRKGFRWADKEIALQVVNKPPSTNKIWRAAYNAPYFLKAKDRSALSQIVKNLVLPAHVKDVLAKLDKIYENDGVLSLDCKIDLALIFLMCSHENFEGILEIRIADWTHIDLKKVRNEFSTNIAEFNRLFCIDVPDIILELNHYHECMQELNTGDDLGFSNVDLDGLNTLDSGIFRSLFGNKLPLEEDVLSSKHSHHSLNFFPLFLSGSDGVTQGLIFDHQEMCFADVIGYDGDGDFKADRGLWDCLAETFAEFSYSYLDELFYLTHMNEEFDFDSGEFRYDELSEQLVESDGKYYLADWFYHLVTLGYLNFQRMPSIELEGFVHARFGSFSNCNQLKKRSSNKHFGENKYFVPFGCNFYPRSPMEIDGNFHPQFSYEAIDSFLKIFEWDVKHAAKKFIHSHPDVFALLGLNTQAWISKSKLTTDDFDLLLEATERFCDDEINAGRPYLAFLIGLQSSESLSDAEERLKLFMFSSRLLQNVPDDICHPIIKTVARLHAETKINSMNRV